MSLSQRTQNPCGLARIAAAIGFCALISASACEFDTAANSAYGCDACEAPDRCVDGFCLPGEPSEPSPQPPQGGQTETDAAPALMCQPGTSELCYDGPDGSDEHPPCRFGRRTCSTEGEFGACAGQIIPVEESCNDVDDDCDGTTDEQLTRDAQVCVAGRFVCEAASMSVPELCDGADNDCDGINDEDFHFDDDPLHCGDCATVCVGDETCCDGACVDTAHDSAYCGSCGTECKHGTICCDGACVDPTADPGHCGACGQRCAGTASCCDGQCVDTQTDRDHCGPFCLNCAQGQACCFGACADLDTYQHCGTCERVCGSDELCCAGACSTGACE